MLALGSSSVHNMPSLQAAKKAMKMSHAIWHAKNTVHFRNVIFLQKQKEEDAVPQTSHQITTWASRTSDHSQIQRVRPTRPRWWKPYCNHWAPKRGKWTRVALHHCSAMGWLVFCTSATFQAAQITKALQDDAEWKGSITYSRCRCEPRWEVKAQVYLNMVIGRYHIQPSKV